MDYKKFIYRKVQIVQENLTAYYWYLINRETREGVHFHGHQYKDPKDSFYVFGDNSHGFDAHGIERHKKTPDREGHTPVKDCDVTGGDCYCDGTSLAASERLGWINPDSSDDDAIYNVLEEYYFHWFERKEDAA